MVQVQVSEPKPHSEPIPESKPEPENQPESKPEHENEPESKPEPEVSCLKPCYMYCPVI